MDLISNLPPDVTDRILRLLPTKEAAKTSTLSRSWRHLWRTIPHLVLDRDFSTLIKSSTPSSSSSEAINRAVTMEIYRALVLHRGPITKFVLAIPGLRPSPEIDQIILHLSGEGSTVQELSLRFGDDQVEPFEFDDESGSSGAIVKTTLPVAAGGFAKLTRLELKQLVLPSDFFGDFVAKNCPLLRELRVLNCDGVYFPKIVAPRLKALYFHSSFQEISFSFTPLLGLVSVLENGIYGYYDNGYKEAKADTAAVFAALPALHHLTLGLEFLLFLAEGVHIPARLPTPLHQLTVLEIPHLYLGNLREARVLVCLIMSSPNLRCLTILLDDRGRRSEGNRVDSLLKMLEAGKLLLQLLPGGGGGGSCLECLEVFDIQNISSGDMHAEMELVRFVFANAKRLRRARIGALAELRGMCLFKYMEKVMGYKRARTQAEVIFDWNRDR